MSDFVKKLVIDKNGNPNEHIIAALWGSFALLIITLYFIYIGHYPTLLEFGGAHGTIWGAAGVGQKLSQDS